MRFRLTVRAAALQQQAQKGADVLTSQAQGRAFVTPDPQKHEFLK
jgi:hypothetical protein